VKYLSRRQNRAGFTLIETEIAFVLLGIALTGLLPLVVVQLKLSRILGRANPRSGEAVVTMATPYLSPNKTFYLFPPILTDPTDATTVDTRRTTWIRKLGASASLRDSDSDFTDDQLQTPVSPITTKSVEVMEAPQRSTVNDTVSVKVLVQ